VALQLTRWKARLVLAGLIVLLSWPFAHYRLVQEYELDPWRFFGFAMYCRPTLPVEVTLEVQAGADRLRLEEEDLPLDGRRVTAGFRRARTLLGRLHPPGSVAAWAFRTYPTAREVAVEVRRAVIDPATGRVAVEARPYRYRRPGT
jgi:hypothetical protein